MKTHQYISAKCVNGKTVYSIITEPITHEQPKEPERCYLCGAPVYFNGLCWSHLQHEQYISR